MDSDIFIFLKVNFRIQILRIQWHDRLKLITLSISIFQSEIFHNLLYKWFTEGKIFSKSTVCIII